jgi:hypothetical protein
MERSVVHRSLIDISIHILINWDTYATADLYYYFSLNGRL